MDSLAATAISDDEKTLRAQLQSAETKLAGLEESLREIEGEWQALADKRAQYEPLEQACLSLEKLKDEGLSRTFWGDRASDNEVSVHLEEVRATIAAVGCEVADVEQRRTLARQNVDDQLDAIEIIEYDLIQTIEREERRKQEWVVERSETELPRRLQIMPWTRGQQDDRRFHQSLLAAAVACLVLGLIVPYIDIPIPEREEILDVPERFASLIRKEPVRPMPAAKPIPQKPVEEKPPEVQPEAEPEVEPEVLPETQIAETPTPASEPESTRERVASAGLLAFRESFSNLAASRPSARLGSEASISNAGDTATGLPQRAMVAIEGPGTSGGINLAELSRDVGSGGGAGGQIEGVQLSRVASSIGGGGSSDRPRSAGAIAGRTDEEIQIVFDRYKAALYRLYNRELRNDPTLRGQMVLRLTIEPDGSVSLCQLQSSDMDAPMLADQVVQRVSGFDFGAKDVPAITILYPIDFLPTA